MEQTDATSDERVEYGLHTPLPGGSSYDIVWDDERITVYIPPKGFTIDRFPDPKTGRESRQLVPCEILNIELAVEKQKWRREALPKDWKKWRKEERQNKRVDKNYVHPEMEKFRQRHWTRRINGCWLALGNKSGKPTEYIYLPGPYWHFLNWWKQDFGYPDFRIPNWEVYLGLCWSYDNPFTNGIALSGNRRSTKTSISMHHMFEQPSRTRNAKAGLQAQTKNDAKAKFTESLVFGFLAQPEFFKPKWDTSQQLKSEIFFRPRLSSKEEDYDDDITDEALFTKIDFRETKSTSYDGYKMQRFSFEEPGKWEEEDVAKTLRTIIPDTEINGEKIGAIFMPTTIEDMDMGGKEFIQIAEDSRPSLMKKNKNGKTSSNLVFIFLAAFKNYIFDEYGRPVIEDPAPDEKVYTVEGKRILKGAKTRLLEDRDAVKHNRQAFVELVRKFPFTWDEAKMMDTSKSPFNVEILEARKNKLDAARSLPFIMGNFNWISEKDGDVEFVRDDIAGRWALHWNPDKYGEYFEGDKRVTNRVGYEWYEDKKIWFPKNSKMFRLGTDPIRYNKTDDPRASKAGAHVWYKFDPSKDFEKPIDEWISHNFIAQYLVRPDEFEIYGEDMIKAMRYFGCHILPEPNVTNLEQYLIGRGYGRFVLYRGNFDDTIMPKKSINDATKGLDSIDYVVDAYIQRLVSFVNKHGHRIHFPELCQQMINFTVKERTHFDCVVSAGYSILAGDAAIEDYVDDSQGEREMQANWFQARDGNTGAPVDVMETDDVSSFFDGL